MDPLHLCIALGPVAAYLLLLGSVNFQQKPFLTTGTRDSLALAVAVSGFVVAGPMELFLPESVAAVFMGWVWLPLIGLYVFGVMLWVLLMRPRLLIYNISLDQLRPRLAQVANELDADSRWAGDSLALPNLGVQLHLDYFPGMRNVQLLSVGAEQNLRGWRHLEIRLRELLADMTVPVNTQGFSFFFMAFMIGALISYSLMTGKQEIAQALRDMLRL